MIVLDGKKTATALKEEIKLTVDNRINDEKKNTTFSSSTCR